MQIYLATSSDTHSISKIWSECFTQDESYIENFIKNCFPYTKTWLLVPDCYDYPVASLSLLPCYTVYKGKQYKGGYVYAVGTLSEHRGNSYSKYLTEEAFRYAKEEKLSFIAVKPATESLYDLYSRLSFDVTLYEKVSDVDPEGRYNYSSDGFLLSDRKPIIKLSSPLLQDNNIPTLYQLREEFQSDTSILWSKEILSYAVRELAFKNGYLAIYYYDNNPKHQYYYICYPLENSDSLVYVADHNIDKGSTLEDFIFENSSLFKNVKIYRFSNLPPAISKRCPTKKIKSGMIKSLESEPGFNKFISKLRLSLPME